MKPVLHKIAALSLVALLYLVAIFFVVCVWVLMFGVGALVGAIPGMAGIGPDYLPVVFGCISAAFTIVLTVLWLVAGR